MQLGRDGYTGVRDTWVAQLDWDRPPQYSVNYGQNAILRLSRDGGENPLIWFDLSSIPPSSTIISATLELQATARSNTGGAEPRTRRVGLFRVLKTWDEGNQVSSPIDAAGKRGATGDFAFSYFTGEGTSIPWAARGMAEGSDYEAKPVASTDVKDPGRYAWDATSLVRAWVRQEVTNAGLVLRDGTGYEAGNNDLRDFVSSQGADVSQRPALTVVYDPDTPWASAGPDQSNLTWTGGPITLDGSGSRDRQGGNDATLAFSWKVTAAAYGSDLGGTPAGSTKISTFTPDRAGEWEFELTVRNEVGGSATDRVRVRLLGLKSSRPRLLLSSSKLSALGARATSTNPRWVALQDEASDPTGDMQAKALVSKVTGSTGLCQEAITRALALAAETSDYSTKAGDIALIYDWCHEVLTAEQKTTFNAYFNRWGDVKEHPNDVPSWGNYWPRWAYSYALVGLATWGDNPRAEEWMTEFRYTRYQGVDLDLLDHIADGGGWPEGMIYDWIANPSRMESIEAWRTATGEDLFLSTPWFVNRLPYILLHRFPGLDDQWGYQFHPYLSTGDSERRRGTITNYERIMALILIERFPSSPFASQLQAYLSTGPTAGSMSFQAHKEFLWYNPDLPQNAPTLLTHYAGGTGTVFMRSAWPSGAADTDPNVTYATFQCGDHFTYHQHYDQNSFTLFKGQDLLIDSGVYSGDGLSYHDANYYVRTIAHNTLLVFNPAEDLTATRTDAESNDGGQRSMYPATRTPPNIQYFTEHLNQYETGDIKRFSDSAAHTYALGDATRAYNSPAYSQSMDGVLPGNVPKVSRYQREFAYLRPAGAGDDDYVVLLDRVGVTQTAFSGANTKLLFHTLGEPTVNGSATTVSAGETLHSGADLAFADRGTARVFIRTLLPQNRNIRKVGGRGVKAFWVNGKQYDYHWGASEPQPRPTNDFEDEPYGEWRLELEPADNALEHSFLTVIQPATTSRASMVATQLVTSTTVTGVHIADGKLNRVAVFSPSNDGAPLSGTLTYSFTPTAETRHFVADLVPASRWEMTTSSSGTGQTVILTPSNSGALTADSGGVVSFETPKEGSISGATIGVGTGSGKTGTRICVPLDIRYQGSANLVTLSGDVTYDPAALTPASVSTTVAGKSISGSIVSPGLYRINMTGGTTVIPAGVAASVCFDAAAARCGASAIGFAAGSLSGADGGGGVVPLEGTNGSVTVTDCASPDELLLSQGRVAVTLTWRNQFNNTTGKGTPVKQMDQYGYFWFDSASNPEVFVKVLDFGC
ncbi:MAG: DNRLRE domain-containing protein [Acidobacteria bacterium]|nr:DNRLRE domain-containing protein [Acidobacteriota bacterium]